MALSGTSGAYYRSSVKVASSVGMHNAYTRHLFVKASATPSTANNKFPCGMVGDAVSAGNQRPHDHLTWNHTSGTFVNSNYHRTSSDVYNKGQMTAANLTANTWHSIAARFNGSTIASFLNGVADGSEATAAAHNTGVWLDALAGITSAGALDGSSQFSIGEIAEMAYWNVALTDDEIVSLAKGFSARLIRPESLVSYHRAIREKIDTIESRAFSLLGGSEVIADHPRVIG